MKYFPAIILFASLVFNGLASPPFTPDTSLQPNDQLAILRADTNGNWRYWMLPTANLFVGNTNALSAAQQAILNNAFTNGGNLNPITFTNPANQFRGAFLGPLDGSNFFNIGPQNLNFATLPAALVVTQNQQTVNLGGAFSGNGGGLSNLNITTISTFSVISTPEIVLFQTNLLDFSATNLQLLGVVANYVKNSYFLNYTVVPDPFPSDIAFYFLQGTNLVTAYPTNTPQLLAVGNNDISLQLSNLVIYGYSSTNVNQTIDFFSQTILADNPQTNRQVANKNYVDGVAASSAYNWSTFGAISPVNLNAQSLQISPVWSLARDYANTNQNSMSFSAYGSPLLSLNAIGGGGAATNFNLSFSQSLFWVPSAGMVSVPTILSATNLSGPFTALTATTNWQANGFWYQVAPWTNAPTGVTYFKAQAFFGTVYNAAAKLSGDFKVSGIVSTPMVFSPSNTWATAYQQATNALTPGSFANFVNSNGVGQWKIWNSNGVFYATPQ